MKKSILTVAVAALALAGCTKNETVEVADSNLIGFNAFVGNATRAVEVDNDNFEAFYVFGTKTSGTGEFFNNTQVYESGTEGKWIYDDRFLWETGQTYTFAAYSNGGEKDNVPLTGMSWDGSALSITDYKTTDQQDLLVAIASNVADVEASNAPVEFTFQHALAMIKFTLNSELGDGDNAIKISEFKVSGIESQGDLTYSTGGVAWSNWESQTELEADDFETETSNPNSSEPFVVIPGKSDVTFTVSFKATFADDVDGTTIKNLTATLSKQMFTAGYRYNYVATITGADMDVITFAKPEVTPWTDTEVGMSWD